MIIEHIKDRREVLTAILSAEKLPVDDLPGMLDNFLAATENGKIIGVAGLEIYGNYGLLRSLAVLSEHRNKGIAGRLIDQLETLAEQKELSELFLLTETASEYFARKSFEKTDRDDVPEEIKKSSEFSHVCPVSAIVMKKSIAKT